MRPDVVTFWHGPLDRAAADLPAIAGRRGPQGHRLQFRSACRACPTASATPRPRRSCRIRFPERLRPPQPDGSWRDWTILQFSDFFRMRLMAEQRRPVARRRRAAAEAGRDRSGKTLFRLGAPAPARQLGAVSAAGRSDRAGVRGSDGAGGTDAGLAGAAPSPDLHAAPVARRIAAASPTSASRSTARPRSTALRAPRGRIAARAAEAIVLCGACRAETVLRADGFFGAARRSRYHRAAHFAKGPRRPAARSRQPLCRGRAETVLAFSRRASPLAVGSVRNAKRPTPI